MNRMPARSDLTTVEFSSLCEIATGFCSSRTISAARISRLIELGLIQKVMGGLMITPTGRIVARR